MSRNSLVLFFLLAAFLILGACQSEGTLTGGVFVVTEDGSNVELGDLTVRAVRSSEMESHLQDKYRRALDEVEKIGIQKKPLLDSLEGTRSTLERRKQRLETLRSEYDAGGNDMPSPTETSKLYALPDALLWKTPFGETVGMIEPGTELEPISKEETYYKVSYADKTGYVLYTSVLTEEHYDGQLGGALNRYSRTLRKCKTLRDSLRGPIAAPDFAEGEADGKAPEFRVALKVPKYRAKISRLSSYKYYFQGIPKPRDTSQTDSEGEFTLTLARGTPYYLLARSTRVVEGSSETHQWMVKTTLRSEKAEIILSNSNMSRTLPDSLDPVANASVNVEPLMETIKICGVSF